MKTSLLTAIILCAQPLSASTLTVSFADGAPKDRIAVTNMGCALTNATLILDLTKTPAGLIFDVTASGAGVEVYQPVEVTAGTILVDPVTDGAQMLKMTIPSLPQGEQFSLSADLDDTVSDRQITVSGSEMLGAQVELQLGTIALSADFNGNGIAEIDVSALEAGCPQA